MAINVENLSFVDLTRFGNFVEPSNLDSFLATDVGKANRTVVERQITEQGSEPNDSMVRRAFFTEQASQNYGTRKADMSDDQMLSSAQPSTGEKVWTLVQEFARKAEAVVGSLVYGGAEAARDGVQKNNGLTGNAAEAMSGRGAAIEQALNGPGPSVMGPR